MATYFWSTLVNGSTNPFNPTTDILNFNDTSISASDSGMLTWTGTDVVFSVGGKANPALNKTVHFTIITAGGRALTDTNVTYLNGSKLLIGDNTTGVVNDDAANVLTGAAGGDLFLGLGGNDTLNGGAGNDVFALGNGSSAFGNDTVNGGTGLGDWIGVGTHASILHGTTVNFSTHVVMSADGSATFTNIENAFGTKFADTFITVDSSRVLTGLGASNGNFDFARVLRGFQGNDSFTGDSRDGYFELVSYTSSPSGVVVNLATGIASDGHDSNLTTTGIQPYTDTLVNIDGVQGSAFNDVLIGGGPAKTFNGTHFEQFEGMGGNDTLNANGATNVRADYSNSPAGVTVNLATGTASDGWGGSDTLIGIAGVRGSGFADTITGDANNNFLEGRGGNDSFNGGAGSDAIFYTAATSAVTIDLALGTSSLTGGQGTDTWVNIEGVRGGDFNDFVYGAEGVDNVLEGLAGADLLDGRGGTDLVRYDRSQGAVNVNLATGQAFDGYDSILGTTGIQSYTDTLVSIERVRGSKFSDTLTGNTGANGFEGWKGNDAINGGAGTDTAEYRNSPGAVTVNLATDTASDGWGGTDSLTSIENAIGSSFNDSLTGDANANWLTGGAGNDTLSGAAGNDAFIYSSALLAGNADVITDFQGGADSIRLDASILAGLTQNGALASALFAAGSGSATTAAQRILYNTATGAVNYDRDGTGGAAAVKLFTLSDAPAVSASSFVVFNAPAVTLWSTLINGGTYLFNAATNILNFDDTSISAGDSGMLTWTGNDVVFSVSGKANAALNKTVHFTVTGGGKALTDTNVTYLNGSKVLIGDNTTGVVNDAAANLLTGTAFNDRLQGLGGNDILNGGAGNDVFVLTNGDLAFGSDTVNGGTGLGDAIGVGTHASILYGATINFSTHTVTSVSGSATFTNIENAFGTNLADTFISVDSSRVLTGLGASNGNFDFGRSLRGYAGNDTFQGDSRSGYFELVSYSDAPSAVVVNLATGVATDGYDSNLTTAGIQSYTDTLVNIDGVQGSAFNDVLIGGGPAKTFSGTHFEQFEGMAGNDTLNANGATGVRADYLNSPAGVTVNLATGTASDGWGGSDTLIGIAGVRGSNFNDTIIGDANGNFLEGRNGNDFIDGGAGGDSIFFSAATSAVTIDLALGSSSLTGGQGTDTWVNIEGVRGGDFNDILRGADGVNNVLEGLAGADLLDGRSGTDLVRYDRSLNAVNVNLATGQAFDGYDSILGTTGIQSFTDTLVSIESVRGSKFNDTLIGNAISNFFEGWAGNDTINGDTSPDMAEYRNSPGAVTVNLAAGTASDGWGGSDSLISIEYATGSSFNDSLTGDANANYLDGGAGNDTLNGGAGNDMLSGGAGNDTLTGGTGADSYHFSSALGATNIDQVMGFSVVDDTIGLENAVFTSLISTGLLAATQLRSGAGFTTAADADDFLIYNTSTGFLYYDAGGTAGGASQHFATLVGAPAGLTAADFSIV